MGKDKQPNSRNEVLVHLIDAFGKIGVAYMDAAASNHIMATSAGILPFALIGMVNPAVGIGGALAVGAVAGMESVPNVAVSLWPPSFGVSSRTANWPSQINIVRYEGAGERPRGTISEKEAVQHLLELGVKTAEAAT